MKDTIYDLHDRIKLIDGFDLGMKGRTGTYLLEEEELTLIETGPSPSVKHVIDGLKALHKKSEDVKYIVLTHIHLDHAGGAGLLLKECPNASVIVHPKGKRHLANPERLIAGAKQVYGSQFNELFDPILPIPEDKLIVKEEGETLQLGRDRTLTFYDTPGHAKHHFAIYDSLSNGLFTGDTAGIRYHQTEEEGGTFYLPSTSPNQFDPEAMLASIDHFKEMKVDRLFFGHFGVTEQPGAAMDEVEYWIPKFVQLGRKAVKDGEGVEGIEKRLLTEVSSALTLKGVSNDHDVYEILKLDLAVCALGIADYLMKADK
ncbi:MBL fold metallo-hydrolase [Halobacillus salinarum]|uniref:MBL fold metallo-hydrolase n=1 Tax=Halobacillus salinarum TaxID=2932257 RepID=A0ABY4EL00_9BACI|nr:MBL fold metallo-hydrolase [Halobacillus salinarum]UOQ42761.1 MBL fold metallo-hydrolase [Halobacillus salinarum]